MRATSCHFAAQNIILAAIRATSCHFAAKNTVPAAIRATSCHFAAKNTVPAAIRATIYEAIPIDANVPSDNFKNLAICFVDAL